MCTHMQIHLHKHMRTLYLYSYAPVLTHECSTHTHTCKQRPPQTKHVHSPMAQSPSWFAAWDSLLQPPTHPHLVLSASLEQTFLISFSRRGRTFHPLGSGTETDEREHRPCSQRHSSFDTPAICVSCVGSIGAENRRPLTCPPPP